MPPRALAVGFGGGHRRVPLAAWMWFAQAEAPRELPGLEVPRRLVAGVRVLADGGGQVREAPLVGEEQVHGRPSGIEPGRERRLEQTHLGTRRVPKRPRVGR